MRYYISDLHFYHHNLLDKMDNRGFSSVEEMNEYIIEQWNKKVRKNDEVVILGDLSYGNGIQTNEILSRLKGKLFLIRGNHDKLYLEDKNFDSSRFGWIRDYAELNDDRKKVILCHYPICCYNGQYRTDERGNSKTYMLYGHIHNSREQALVDNFINITRQTRIDPNSDKDLRYIPCHMINCFCMYSDYQPLSLMEWIENDIKRKNPDNI